MPAPKTRLNKTTAPAVNKVNNAQPKKRGTQNGTSVTQHGNLPNNGQSTEETPAQKPPKKRTHQTADNIDDAPPAKKGRTVKDAAAANVLPVAELVPHPKATRPARNGKSAGAIGSTQDAPKRRRRTKEEIAADKEKTAASKEAKRQAAEELIRKSEEAKAFFAQMNIDEEQADAWMEKENPRRLSAVKRKRRGGQGEESEGESFDEVPPGSDESGSEIEIIVSVRGLNTIWFSS